MNRQVCGLERERWWQRGLVYDRASGQVAGRLGQAYNRANGQVVGRLGQAWRRVYGKVGGTVSWHNCPSNVYNIYEVKHTYEIASGQGENNTVS